MWLCNWTNLIFLSCFLFVLQPRDGNLFLWDIALIVVNPTSLYCGAYLKVLLSALFVPGMGTFVGIA